MAPQLARDLAAVSGRRISRESGACFSPSYVIEIDRYWQRNPCVGGIMSGRRTPLYVFNASTVNSQRYRESLCEAVLDAMGLDYVFMDDNARPKIAHNVDEFYGENIRSVDWPSRYVTIGCSRVRRTNVVDRIHLSAPLHVRTVSARTIRRRLQQSGLSARHPLFGLPLPQNHRRLLR
ncbi:hypothetical protein TNCV_4663791 [Trichonephila clavipes]|uniref:Uncharacterized protein n=1 Tax=Trichonephila clavipes TaxID=2585209 RepID=A0A8X6VJ55_TRICX|nr:hypothetical protein TNCV_4663791 [Trichonephila clavipes]